MPCWNIIKGVEQVKAAKLPYKADIRSFNLLHIISMVNSNETKWLILAKDQLSMIKNRFLASVFLSLNSWHYANPAHAYSLGVALKNSA